jgi:CHAT domain-containing protein/tetratricopeptide (TPR) repeat protein
MAAAMVVGSARSRTASLQQAGEPAPLDRARIEDLVKQSGLLIVRGAPAEVVPLLQPLLKEALERDRALEANVYYYLGRAYDDQSRYVEALADYQRALDDYRTTGNRRQEARALLAIAQVHKNTGDYERGIALGEEALALYTEVGDDRFVALSSIVLGAIHDSVGDHRRALESFERALPLLAAERNAELVNLLNEIGITQKNLGRYSEAVGTYSRGLDLAREIRDPGRIALLSLSLAELDNTIGEPERALELDQEALRLVQATPDRRGEMNVLQSLAESYWMLGNRQRALETKLTALDAARQMGLRNQQEIILEDLGEMRATLGELGPARQLYTEALGIQREIGDRNYMPLTLVALADLDLREGLVEEALRSAEEGLSIAHQSERPELEWTARRAVARAAAASGLTARAIEELRASTRIINDLRANVASDMSKVAFVDRRQEVFGDLAALLVAGGRPEEALEAAEAGRARAFADLLKQRQILGKAPDRDALATVRRAQEDYQTALAAPPRAATGSIARSPGGNRGGEALVESVTALAARHHELASLLTAESPAIQDIRDTIGRLHATLVEYLVTDRQLLAWVVGPGGVTHSATTDVSREHLEALATAVRTAVDEVVNAGTARPATGPTQAMISLNGSLRELDQLLIAPLARWLPPSPDTPVVIIPHGPLALVPFAALRDESGRSLLDRHVLSFAPAASVFTYTRDKHSADAGVTGQRALVVADPAPPEGSGLEPLPYAREEGRRVASQLGRPGVRLLVGGDATEAAVKRESGAFSILHFATHGLVAPDQPLASSLVFGAGSGEDGYLRVDEIFSLDLTADLVVLSGCSTGLGKLTGDGIVGLTRAFLYAGTPTVVVSQWNVSDRATSRLMVRFYAELGRGASRAQALRTAALAVKRQFPHPAFWAAFEVVGEP